MCESFCSGTKSDQLIGLAISTSHNVYESHIAPEEYLITWVVGKPYPQNIWVGKARKSVSQMWKSAVYPQLKETFAIKFRSRNSPRDDCLLGETHDGVRFSRICWICKRKQEAIIWSLWIHDIVCEIPNLNDVTMFNFSLIFSIFCVHTPICEVVINMDCTAFLQNRGVS